MNAVQWYSEIEQQFNYRHDFIGGPHFAEPEKIVTGICKAHEKEMQSLTRKDTLGIYLVHLFEVWQIFLRFGTDRCIPGLSFLSLVMTRICQGYNKTTKDMNDVFV